MTRNQNRPTKEQNTDGLALLVLANFREKRESLMAEWSAEPTYVAADRPPKPSVVERRRAKAVADLSRWMRKLKLAQTKVKKLRQRVAYYERKVSQP